MPLFLPFEILDVLLGFGDRCDREAADTVGSYPELEHKERYEDYEG